MSTTDTTIPVPEVSPETLAHARQAVAELLSSSDSFKAMEPGAREKIAGDTARIAAVLAEPLATRESRSSRGGGDTFQAQGAREGAAVAGLLLEQVNFTDFVSGLVKGVFHAIVQSSIEQMEAYGKLVADVAKSLNDFRDENVPAAQGREHLVDQFPDTFMMELDTGEDGVTAPRVRVRDGVDEDVALQKVNTLPLDGAPVRDLEDETIEERLVPAARTQLATSRQQLLATMVVMGINRIVVTDGRISAKVMYDFRASDTFHKQLARTEMEYGDQYRTTGTSEFESDYEGGETSGKWDTEKYSSRGASYYTKGKYSYAAEPVLNLASATTETTDASLSTKASLAGMVDVNFKSDYLPLEKMADSFQIARIQDAAQPARTAPAPAASTPPPAAQTPAAPAP